MESQKDMSHIDAIHKAEQDAAEMVTATQKKQQEEITKVQTAMQNQSVEYTASVAAAQEKRAAAHRQDVDQKVQSIQTETQEKCDALIAQAKKNHIVTVQRVIDDIINSPA